MSAALGTVSFDPADIQGNILRGYNFNRARFLMLQVVNAGAARRWLGATVSGGEDAPAITSEVHWSVKPPTCFNIGITAPGLRALGVSATSIASFPNEFVEGMNARAMKLGDVGPSAPDQWVAPFQDPDTIHLIATIHADDVDHLDRVQRQVAGAGGGHAFAVRGVRDGYNFDRDFVHFGYRDNFSQPRFCRGPRPRRVSGWAADGADRIDAARLSHRI